MHTIEVTETGGKIWRFHYNLDMSGHVEIARETWDDHPVKSCFVPGEVLVKFVAEVIRLRKTTALEQATYLEILGL